MQFDNYTFNVRSTRIWGEENSYKLKNARVVVVGLGGVGSAAAEGLCRAGIGSLLLIDFDTLEESNLNRQLISTTDKLGQLKAEVLAERLTSINPKGSFTPLCQLINAENLDVIKDFKPDYVVDAIDMVTSKLALIKFCKAEDIPIISCFGTGNRLDPSKLTYGTAAQTAGISCAFARTMRSALKKAEITDLQVVFSTEVPQKPAPVPTQNGRNSPGSTAFVPPAAGFLLGSLVVRSILNL